MAEGFFQELRRRNVVRVGAAYLVFGWIIMQIIDVVVEPLRLPDWTATLILLLLAIGLPLALFLSWAYELTPSGVKKTEEVDQDASVTKTTGQRLDFLIIGALIVALGYFLWERQGLVEQVESGPSTATTSTATPAASTPGAEAVAAEKSIAVLPFVNMSDDAANEYFSDGISEELLNVLVRVEGLKVASRTSSFIYKGQNLNITEIAGELKVDHILEGSVRKAGNRVRITAQLIDAKTGLHLWSETYDRELTDIFAIQDEIANAIVTALRGTLGLEAGKAVTVKAATRNMSAYDAYLKGREMFLARKTLPEATALFEQAVELDANFARAWEGLAAIYSILPSWDITDRDYIELSSAAVDRALALDPDLAFAWAVKANLANNEIPADYVQAAAFLDKAIALDPKQATPYLWRAINYMDLGFFEEAMADLDRCLALDPAYGNCQRHKAINYLLMGEVTAGLKLFEKGLEDDYLGAEAIFTPALVWNGQRLAALLNIRRLFNSDGLRGFPAAEWVRVLEDPGADREKAWAKIETWSERNGAQTFQDALFLLSFGRFDEVRAGNFGHYGFWLKGFPGWLGSPHFKRVMREKGVLDYWAQRGYPPQCRAVGADDFECDGS